MPNRDQSHMETVRYVRLSAPGGPQPAVEAMHARFVDHTFSKHFHERYALGCIESGAMGFRYRGENLVAPAGQVNLVVPGECHDGHPATPGGWTYRMFYLPVETVAEAAFALLPRSRHLPHFRPGVINDPQLATCVRATHGVVMTPDAPTLEKQTRLYWLLVHWINRHADDKGNLGPALREPGKAEAAREYLDAHLAEDISLDEVAVASGVSKYHLVKIFSRRFGLTPHAYLIQARVRAARKKILAGGRLADVAAETGFCDQAHLTRAFKRQLGATPGAWRNFLQVF